MTLRLISCPSPNHDARPQGAPVDILVLHYTGMPTAEGALARLCDPAAKVSAHYTIGRDGRVFAHVPEERRAWHAGLSYWAGETNVNARSIGIELVNPGHEFGYIPFPEPQIAALIELSHGILSRHPIPSHRVVGHSDVAPARKEDPGELFPWARLAAEGIGLWPISATDQAPAGQRKAADPSDALVRFGYGVGPHTDVPLDLAVTAFQRHFRPNRLDGVWDAECGARLEVLLKAVAKTPSP